MLQNHNQDDLNNYPSCLKDLTSLTLNLSLEIAQIVFQTISDGVDTACPSSQLVPVVVNMQSSYPR